MTESRHKGPTTVSNCWPLGVCQETESLWLHRPVLDPHVVDQAGPEGTGGEALRKA